MIRIIVLPLASALLRATAPAARTRAVRATAQDASPRASGLALQLDDGTRKVHSVAENTQFVTGFFKGLGDAGSFSQLTASFFYVYEAMERALDESSNPTLDALDFPQLRRLPGLERDLDFYSPDWRATLKPSRATAKYVTRIEEVAASDTPELLVGHLYSRYLGDLFGGQMMSGMARKSLGAAVGDGKGGLAFYEFSDIADTRGFIDEWYTALNALDLDAATREAIVEEANVVFRLNIELFDELEGNPIKSVLALALGALKEKLFGGGDDDAE